MTNRESALPGASPAPEQEPPAAPVRYRRLPPVWGALVVACGAVALLLALNQLLNLGFFVGRIILDNA